MIRYKDIKKIHVELSSKCNLSCPGCPRNVQGGYELPWLNKTEFSINRFKELFPKNFLSQLNGILFCGNYGDPGTCKDILPILEYVKSCTSAHIRIHTNGSIKTPDFWYKVGKTLDPSDAVIWSIDGLEDTNHLYRRNASWNKIIDNVKSFISSGGQAIWEYLIFKHNEHQIQDAKKLSSILNFSHFQLKKAFGFECNNYAMSALQVMDKKGNHEYFIYPPKEKYKNINALTSKNPKNKQKFPKKLTCNEFVKNNKLKQRELNTLISKGLFDYLNNVEISCMTINNLEIYIDSSGGVHPCCFLGHASQQADSDVEIQYFNFIKEHNLNGFEHGIKHVVENSYFDLVKKSWTETNKNNQIAQCFIMCSKKNNVIKSLYNKENA